eukprot:Partr_v1_DN28064_c2_g1_i2_m57226 putative ATP-dependent serine protease that mediates the selective degradation of misfolded, unassembled or oxidatively damaged polypeptides as well as certain short-lived regulatory proteins in the mitochondrial matrix. May also have a chaperone function in the assembly of inner membrane protein complexes. Participates in the regulation of mitochondrial gene expression and in the maintenance of the integrity of the mitochondrial genome. Binds to mitochondrial DN
MLGIGRRLCHPPWCLIAQRRLVRIKAGSSGGGSSSSAGGGSGRSKGQRATAATPSPTQQEAGIAKPRVPDFHPNVLVLPITHRPLFPQSVKSFVVRDPAVAAALKALLASGEPYIGAFMTRDDERDVDTVSDLKDIHRVGVFAQLLRADDVTDTAGMEGAVTATIFPHRRVRIESLLSPSGLSGDSPYLDIARAHSKATYALVDNVHDEPYTRRNPVIKALTSEILSVLKSLLRFNPEIKNHITAFSYSSGISLVDEPAMLADFVASIVPYAESAELQSILESAVVEERLQKSLVLLKKELANSQLQSQINRDVEEKMAKARKEYYLLEHMKGIQKELGLESDGREKLIETFKSRAASLSMPSEVATVFQDEIARFQTLEPAAMEFNVTRNYLDWLTMVPWGQTSEDCFDLANARRILDTDHHGMKDVKDRILEFIAVGKLNRSTVQGKILCLSGPPGVGKTSIGKSVAASLGREFYRFSVGGLGDVSEIKGHRRTYVGAMPGKLVQALKKVKTENPLILIDEVDKIGRNSHRGDPSSALLEVLDPEQNSSFMDHFMDVPIDLSKVLFMCTANVLDTIPGPLLDRMEVIQLAGYVLEEKMEIAKRYLCPDALAASGLTGEQVKVTDDAIRTLINSYCRESGVRNLKKHVEKIYRKAALTILRAKDKQLLTVDAGNLKTFVGNPVYSDEIHTGILPPGIVMGLAWTGMGGASLFVESLADAANDPKNPKSSIKRTGQLGDVMKESIGIAHTFARSLLLKHDPENTYFAKNRIHVHVPEGATPKDGPSAGVTMCTSLLSLALNKSIPNCAMTGELTLTGHVLKIGGLKEKLIAAKRSGVTRVIFPAANQLDYEDLEDYVKAGIKVDFVRHYSEIYDMLFMQGQQLQKQQHL